MKILFVASGNDKKGTFVSFIEEQAKSLKNKSIEVDYFAIKGKSFLGYLRNVRKLRKKIKSDTYDVIHSHYTLSAYVSLLASPLSKHVVSLMGTDVYGKILDNNKVDFKSRYLTLLTLAIQPFVNHLICKSPNLQKYVYLKYKSSIIPNGIDLNKFKIYENLEPADLNLNTDTKKLLFLASKDDPRKNFRLISEAFELLKCKDLPFKIELVCPYPVSHEDIVKFLNLGDVLVSCSYREGSPNIVKEAMACNCPVVTTDVGDVGYLLQNCEGNKVVGFDKNEMADAILDILKQGKRSEGRRQLQTLKLSDEQIAERIIDIYKSITN